MGDNTVSKWAAGTSYGPVLSQTDLYLLNTDLQLNPILQGTNPGFHLLFNLVTGSTGGFNPEARDRDLNFTQKDEPATLPRVTQLIIITELSPWCTIIHNERGVTMSDVCTTIWKEYTENYVSDQEFNSLPPRLQEHVKRAATNNQQAASNWSMYYNTPAPPSRYKRVDWLRDKIYFDYLTKKDNYSISRLGFKAPNIFVMCLAS
ncbi:hypothetical protein EDD16DRAFT_589701 [Pisolithus croceorrhizus]|nr:hypothetical protein F5141DRAFT_1112799 [Pisolithus sp. B1]KAI6123964.1 hypothetical protein EDD16DRAFT_589701 [Pisolithus croceorrhizus]